MRWPLACAFTIAYPRAHIAYILPLKERDVARRQIRYAAAAVVPTVSLQVNRTLGDCHWRQVNPAAAGDAGDTSPIFWLGRDVNGNIPQYYYFRISL